MNYYIRSISVLNDPQSSQSCSKRLFILLGVIIGLLAVSTTVLALILALKSKTNETTNGISLYGSTLYIIF